jgi:hypothetical protein
MRRKLFYTLLALLVAGAAMAALVSRGDYFIQKLGGDQVYVTQVLELSADGSGDLGTELCGGYLFSVEITTSTDDAVTFTIDSRLGTELFSRTTTAATSGEIANPSGFWPMNYDTDDTANDYPTYELADMSGGTATAEITVAKR